MKVRDNGRWGKIGKFFHSLVHSSNDCNGCAWARPVLGAVTSTQLSQGTGRSPAQGPSSALPGTATGAELEQPGLKVVYIWDASVSGNCLIGCVTPPAFIFDFTEKKKGISLGSRSF